MSKEELFITTVKAVIVKLNKHDSAGLHNFINKEIGVYILNSIGTKQTYNHYKTIGFSDSTYPNNSFYPKVKFTTIRYAPLPIFDCTTEKWTKKGLYVDTLKTDHTLSRIAKSRNKIFNDNIPTEIISSFFDLEMKSRRVILVNDSNNDLVFYLTYRNNKWVLTIIDKVTSDCSV